MPHLALGRALAACLALAAAGAGAQPMYRWVDEKGVTHFSQEPPADGRKASRIEPKIVAPNAPVAAPRDTPEAWKEQDAEFRRRQLDRAHRDEVAEREGAERARKCAEAQRRLGVLEEPRRVYKRDAQGARVYITDEERPASVAEQRAIVRENCD